MARKNKEKMRPGFGSVRPSSEPPSAHLAIIALQTPILPDSTRQHISLSAPKHSAVTPKTNKCMGCRSDHFSPACASECTLFPFCFKIQILVMHDCRRSEQNFISWNTEKDMEKNIWLSMRDPMTERMWLLAVVEHTVILFSENIPSAFISRQEQRRVLT